MTAVFLVLARTLHIGSAMLLVALPYFRLVILRPIFMGDVVPDKVSFGRSIIRWLGITWIVEAVSGVVWFWWVVAQMSDQSPWSLLDWDDFGTVSEQTQFGQLWLGRAVAGIVLAVILFLASRQKVPTSRLASILNWLALAVGGVLLISLAWAGHADAGVHDHILHLLADILHLLLGAIWPLGLIPLVFFLRHLRRTNPVLPSNAELKAVQRFSQSSLIAVLVLLVTGFINGWLMIGSWDALFTTTYGRLLLGKVLVVGVMIGLGAFNRLCLMPRIREDTLRFRTLQKTVLAESALALLVVLIVGILGMTAPGS